LFVAPYAHSDDDKDIAALFNGTAD
jgi:hypothetical protein